MRNLNERSLYDIVNPLPPMPQDFHKVGLWRGLILTEVKEEGYTCYFTSNSLLPPLCFLQTTEDDMLI